MTKLSNLFTDPKLQAVFARAERDNGAAFAVSTAPKPVLIGGAARVLEAA